VILSDVPRPDRCGDDPPFSPERLARRLVDSGQLACFAPDLGDAVTQLADSLEPGDVVVFMSNSGFGGIQKRLLTALQEKHGAHAR
jgi:UDP-N-acetylmuramate-alanine ligase